MRTLPYETIVTQVAQACETMCHELPSDVLAALEQARQQETHATAQSILTQIITNAQIAPQEQLPLCQDTGVTVVFVEQGRDVTIEAPDYSPDATVADAINAGVQLGYDQGYLRKSIVADPLNGRVNTGTNTPAVIHHSQVPGDQLMLKLMAKGGGCENKSQFKMFLPTADPQSIVDWVKDVATGAGANACPPLVVGVGIGGNFEMSCLLSKKALMRKLTDSHPDPFYAQLEQDMLTAINASGVGPQGFGGDTTALGVCIEKAPCHIASLPVAVNIECHSHRHIELIIDE